MNGNKIKEHFEKGRIQLTKWETVEHYSFIFPFLTIAVMFLFIKLSSTETINRIPTIEIGIISISIYFIYNRYKSLEFKKYHFEHTVEDFQLAAKATAIELNWRIEKLTNTLLIARKNDLDWQWDGLKITIIRDGNKIYSNSMIAPSIRSNPFSIGWNKKNLQLFNNNLIYVKRGEDIIAKAETIVKEEEIRLENESEWNLKNTIKRIIVYFFIFIILGGCVLILSEGFSYIIIPIGVICIGYLIMDWMMIIKKMKKKNARP
jgi:hypothetical protein